MVFCIGVMADKDYAEMLKLLVPLAKAFVCYRPDNPRALSESDLADAVQIAVGSHPVEVVQPLRLIARWSMPLGFLGIACPFAFAVASMESPLSKRHGATLRTKGNEPVRI